MCGFNLSPCPFLIFFGKTPIFENSNWSKTRTFENSTIENSIFWKLKLSKTQTAKNSNYQKLQLKETPTKGNSKSRKLQLLKTRIFIRFWIIASQYSKIQCTSNSNKINIKRGQFSLLLSLSKWKKWNDF